MIGFQYNNPDADSNSKGICIFPSRIILLYDGMGVVIPKTIRRALSGNRFKRNRLKEIDMFFRGDKYKPDKIEEIENKSNFTSTFIETRSQHIFKYIMSYNISGTKKILKKKFENVDFASCHDDDTKSSRRSTRRSVKQLGGHKRTFKKSKYNKKIKNKKSSGKIKKRTKKMKIKK